MLEDDITRYINVACGRAKIHGYWNIDAREENCPDQVIDIIHEFPFESESAKEILFFHAIEHIEEKYHRPILEQFHRVLELDGMLYISYPEFKKCAANYINNHCGQKDFWKATIYGLQRYPGDFHVTLMDTEVFVDVLQSVGFKDIQFQPERGEEFNTIVRCQKGIRPPNYEELMLSYLDEAGGDRN